MKVVTRMAALTAVALVVVAFSAAACTSPGTGSEESRDAGPDGTPAASGPALPTAMPTVVTIEPPTSLITPGTLVDCVDIEYPPMEFFPPDVTDASQAIGFDVDAARAAADRLGLAIEIRNTAFDSLIPDLTNGRCDIVWSALYVSEARLEVADAVPYMATGHVLMVRAGNEVGITQESDLCGKTLAIQGGGLVEERAEAASAACESAGAGKIEIRAHETVAEELQQIVNGRVDAVWETDTGVANFMLEHPNEYEVAYAFPRDDNYGVYYAKGKTDLGDALQAAIDALKADGTLAAIAQQYSMDPAILDVVQ